MVQIVVHNGYHLVMTDIAMDKSTMVKPCKANTTNYLNNVIPNILVGTIAYNHQLTVLNTAQFS